MTTSQIVPMLTETKINSEVQKSREIIAIRTVGATSLANKSRERETKLIEKLLFEDKR